MQQRRSSTALGTLLVLALLYGCATVDDVRTLGVRVARLEGAIVELGAPAMTIDGPRLSAVESQLASLKKQLTTIGADRSSSQVDQLAAKLQRLEVSVSSLTADLKQERPSDEDPVAVMGETATYPWEGAMVLLQAAPLLRELSSLQQVSFRWRVRDLVAHLKVATGSPQEPNDLEAFWITYCAMSQLAETLRSRGERGLADAIDTGLTDLTSVLRKHGRALLRPFEGGSLSHTLLEQLPIRSKEELLRELPALAKYFEEVK